MPEQRKKKFLTILTSHDRLGDTGKKTGFHFQEMSDPYYIFEDNEIDVSLASIRGGKAPADPASVRDEHDANEESVRRFLDDEKAMHKLENTIKIENADPQQFEGIYLSGGHGTMWDFPESAALKKLIEEMWGAGKLVGAVCHGPAGLLNAVNEDGELIIKGKLINCFTNEEEKKVEKDAIVPFLLETALREKGAYFECVDPFQATTVEDGHLITGQNPASASLVAHALLQMMGISAYQQSPGRGHNLTSEATS